MKEGRIGHNGLEVTEIHLRTILAEDVKIGL